MIIKTLKALGWATGVALVALGAARILFGIATVAGGGPASPTVDSEIRASGALLVALGLAYVWTVCQSPIPAAPARFLAMTMTLIVVSRLISIGEVGSPHWSVLVFAAIELLAAVLTYWYSTMGSDKSTGGRPAVR